MPSRSVAALVLAGAVLAAAAVAIPAPTSAATTWTVAGPEGGTVRAIAIRPGDPSVLLAGTGGAGIFRSGNGGATWSPSRQGLPADTIVNAITFAPSDPDVVFAGTHGFGAARSQDGGATWQQVWSDSTVLDVTVDPLDADRVAIAVGVGVHLSTNGGETWEELRQGLDPIAADRVAFAPSEANVLYVGGVAGVLRTTNSGDSWVASPPDGPTNVTALAVHPTNANRIYAGTHFDGVFVSGDGGASWEPASDGLPSVESSPDVHLPIRALLVDPTRPWIVYAGTDRGGRLHRSTDRGESWDALPLRVSAHPVRALAADPTDGKPLYAALDHDGLALSTDGADTWSRANDGLVGTAIPDVVALPGSSTDAVAGTIGRGIFRTTNGGASWRRTDLAGMNVTGLSAVQARPNRVYAAASRGLFRSDDRGASWRRVRSLDLRHLVDVAMAPTDPSTIYAIRYQGLWRSTNGGDTWKHMSSMDTLSSITVHPNRPRTIFLGMAGGVLRSNDGGATWEDPPDGFPSSLNGADVAVDPTQPRFVYAATDPFGTFKSRDGGRSWKPIATELGLWHAQVVVIDPEDPATVYLGGFDVSTGGGVFRSDDRGVTWEQLAGSGLTTTWVWSLAVSPDASRVYAGTTAYSFESGGGVFTRALP